MTNPDDSLTGVFVCPCAFEDDARYNDELIKVKVENAKSEEAKFRRRVHESGSDS